MTPSPPPTCMWDETGPDQLAHHDRQVGGNRYHPVLQVVVQLTAVICNLNHLWQSTIWLTLRNDWMKESCGQSDRSDEVVTENLQDQFQDKDEGHHHQHRHCGVKLWRWGNQTHLITQVHDVSDVLLRHLRSHGDLSSQFNLGLGLLWEDVRQIGARHVRPVTWHTQFTVQCIMENVGSISLSLTWTMSGHGADYNQGFLMCTSFRLFYYQFCGQICSKPSYRWRFFPAQESASRTTPCSA